MRWSRACTDQNSTNECSRTGRSKTSKLLAILMRGFDFYIHETYHKESAETAAQLSCKGHNQNSPSRDCCGDSKGQHVCLMPCTR